MFRSPPFTRAAVEQVHRVLVAVHRDHGPRVPRRDAGERPRVRSQVPQQAWTPRRSVPVHKALLALEVLVVVRVRFRVLGPVGARRAVRQSVDESRQAVQQGQERHPGLPALGHRALRVGATTSHPPLRLRREPHVRQDAALEPPQPVEVFGRVLRRYAVQAGAQQRLEGYAEMRHEHERREERRTELTVSPPVLAILPRNEGWHVREEGPRADPLDVERGGVLEHPAVPDGRIEQAKLQKRRVLEHRERPLVRPGDELHRLVLDGRCPAHLDHAGSRGVVLGQEGRLRYVAISDQSAKERLGKQPLDRLSRLAVQPANDPGAARLVPTVHPP